MKNLFKSAVLGLALLIGGSVMAQDKMMKKDEMMSKAEVIKLTQTPGKFNKKELKLKAGEPYVFEVTNKGVDHAVGFVVAPKGKTDQANHIKNAYVKEMVKEGQTQSTNEVVLEKGEYVFFCPMNPTPEYSIVVK